MSEAREVKKCAIVRDKHVVTLTLSCKDEYAAMLLYDRLIAEAEAGGVSLSFTTYQSPQPLVK